MGATFVIETVRAESATAAYLTFLAAAFTCDEYWEDPAAKPGHVMAWDKDVAPCAVDWMIGWTRQHPPAGVDPEDKWGPWLALHLEEDFWCFFGWVNT